MSEDDPRTGEATAGAEAAFASFLARIRRGEDIDFESYCRERPGLAEPLRRLHAAWESQRKAAGAGSAPSIRDFLETGSKTAGEQTETDSGVRERILRLAARTGRYSLKGEVARGGMGVILRVWDRDLRRTLAMKATFTAAPTRAPDQDEMVTRFLEEAQITGQLDHPGIVPVHELGVDEEGRMFFTMRLVKGQTLDQIIRLARKDEGGWTRVRALNVILRVCEAMAYAHAKGVIHRDLKPANIMVGKYGEVYVMDWGLAKVMGRPDVHDRQLRPDVSILHSEIRTDRVVSDAGSSPVMTMEGTIIGTPTYMPPEQAEGRIDALDPRSDIYSVGALLYTLLTGWMPYVDPDHPITGGRVLQGTCFYQQYAREIGEANGWKRLLSNSAKIVNILGGYGYLPALASMERCIASAEAGRIV